MSKPVTVHEVLDLLAGVAVELRRLREAVERLYGVMEARVEPVAPVGVPTAEPVFETLAEQLRAGQVQLAYALMALAAVMGARLQFIDYRRYDMQDGQEEEHRITGNVLLVSPANATVLLSFDRRVGEAGLPVYAGSFFIGRVNHSTVYIKALGTTTVYVVDAELALPQQRG